jgi:26S proteasome regulatory subunit N5
MQAVVPYCVLLQGIPTLGELKLRYYELMIQYYQHYHNYLEICRCYKAIYESDSMQDNAEAAMPVSILLAVLS